MKKTLIFVLLIFTSNILKAQNQSSNDANIREINYQANKDNANPSDIDFLSAELLSKAKGSPFDHDSFTKGRTIQKNKDFFSEVYYRYNIFNDQIEIANDSSSKKALKASVEDPETIIYVGEKPYVFLSRTNDDNKSGFFHLISENEDHTIIKKSVIHFIPGVKAKTSYDKDSPAKFERVDTYYLRDMRSGQMTLLPKSKKKILKVLPNQQAELKSFIKKEGLKFKEDGDFIKLGEFLKMK